MKGSLVTIFCFIAGCLTGFLSGFEAEWIDTASLWLLYLLMFQAGIGIGANREVPSMIRGLSPKIVLLPIATIAGAVVMSGIASLLLRWSGSQCMAVGGACGYYSLSSIMISRLMEPTLGVTLAAELATIALLANILRELFALTAAPYIVRRFGAEAEIAAAGVTSVDVCFPAINRWCGDEYVPAAIVSGVIIDVSTPFLITFFCSL